MTSTESIAKAIGSIPEKKEKLRKAFDELHSLSSSLSSFTLQWKDLEDYLSAIEKSIDLRFKELQSKKPHPQPQPQPLPESDIPDPQPQPPSPYEDEEEEKEAAPRPELMKLCVNMDGLGLRVFVNENRKDLENLRKEIVPALRAAPDPARLVLDAVGDFYTSSAGAVLKKGKSNTRDLEVHANRRTCILLLERLHALSPNVKPEVKESAKELALEWKEKFSPDAPGDNSLEAWAFLQLLASYHLVSEFDINDVLDVIIPISRRKPTIDVCKNLDITDKIPDLIEKLKSKGKHLDAVKFVYAFDLVEKFPPVPLLKAHIKESKRLAEEVRKKGNNSAQSRNEAVAKEISALKIVIKAIEEYKLGAEYSPDQLKKQVEKLEHIKAEKKRTAPTASVPSSNSQQQYANKRARSSGSNAMGTVAPYPQMSSSQSHYPLAMTDRSPYLSAAGPYGIAGQSALYDHAGAGFLGASMGAGGKQSPPPKSYMYPSETRVGAGLYDRPAAYERPLTYEMPGGYDRQVAYDRPSAYERPATFGGATYSLSGGLPPQYNQSRQP